METTGHEVARRSKVSCFGAYLGITAIYHRLNFIVKPPIELYAIMEALPKFQIAIVGLENGELGISDKVPLPELEDDSEGFPPD